MLARSRSQQRMFILASIAFFLGTASINALHFYSVATADASGSAAVASQEPTLEDQEHGYELVLQREPDNQVALKGLAATRIEMNNPKGAIAPLEKLVKLNPGQAEYATLLADAKQKAGQ
ncbi:MAG TPA: tetratricopeptide repeat protein [Crinalium sp.]|jgi:predicted Zn-dependent protease